jgi:hypothetical protein
MLNFLVYEENLIFFFISVPYAGITMLTMLATIGWSATVGIPIFSLDEYPDWAPSTNVSLSGPGSSRC